MLTIIKIARIMNFKQSGVAKKRKFNKNPYQEKLRDWPEEASATTCFIRMQGAKSSRIKF